ncbi:MAG: hypothetical protein ABIX37_10115 [Gammaproteobacteria bacterium]
MSKYTGIAKGTGIALTWAALAMMGVMATGCEKKGPVEQAGEEVDEAMDTMKNGKESTASKLDDAVDELKD